MPISISINQAAAFNVDVGVPGPAGPAGPAGPQGQPGAPGQGVPVGGSSGQFLTKIDGTDYNTNWTSVNLTGFLTKANNLSDLTNFATARDNLQLGASNNPTFSGVNIPGTGASVANLGATFLTINQAGVGQFTIQPSQGIVFPNGTIQTTAFTGVPADFITSVSSPLSVTAGNLSIDLSSYLTSSTAAATYQTLAGMSVYATQSFVTSQGYITSSALAPYLLSSTAASTYQTIAGMSVYATKSFVTSQGYITSAALAGYATEEWVLLKNYIPYDNVGIYVNGQEQTIAFNGTQLGLTLEADPEAYRTSLGLGTIATEAATDYARRNGTTFTGTVNLFGSFVNSNSIFQFVGGGYITMSPTETSNSTARYSSNGIQITGGTGSGLQALFLESGIILSSVGANPGTTIIRAGTPSTFGAKVNCTANATNAGINIGTVTAAPTNIVAGDLFIGSNLSFRGTDGFTKTVALSTATNVFGSPQIIDTTATTPALRVTQKGTGNSLIVEDSTTPDTSSLVVDASGNVGIGVATGYTSTSKVEVVGNVKADTFSNGAGPTFSFNSTASHTGGPSTLDLIVTIGGVNYRIALRPA